MKKNKWPVTPASRFLKKNNAAFTPHLYPYEEKGGTKSSSTALNVKEHVIIKTLIMEDESKEPMIVLMHGDMEVSTKNLARTINKKSITPCNPERAQKLTGYMVGGTSPFGTLKTMKIYIEESILQLDTIFINGGKRGFLFELSPSLINLLLDPIVVSVGIKSS